MIRGLLLLLLLSTIGLTGCEGLEKALSQDAPTTNEIQTQILEYPEPPEDQNWIYPPKVIVNNFKPGYRAEYTITIHNGGPDSYWFAISYLIPVGVREDLLPTYEKMSSWVTFEEDEVLLAPKETRTILVSIEMPEDEEPFAEDWEFWVGALSNSGQMVRTQLGQRWIVHMGD